MPVEVVMPKVDMVMETGTVVRWYCHEQQQVTAGEPLLEIETDKSTIDVEAPASGVLSSITVHPGDVVPVATRIALILAPGESLPAPSPPQDASSPQELRPRATPAARALARRYGLDLALLAGSGPQGRVRKADVLQAATDQPAPATVANGGPHPHAAPEPGPLPIPPPEPAQVPLPRSGAEGELVPLTGVRRLVAERLQLSAAIPTFTLTAEVDMSAVQRIRERLPFRPSVTSIIARAVATLLLKHPELNSSFRPEGIWRYHSVHLGIAMDSTGQLLVPVIHDAQRMGLQAIHAELASLRTRAAERRLGPADLRGSSFSISNLGMFGVDTVTAVINPPEAAILAVGRTAERPVGRNGTLLLCPMATLTLSVDHRVTDGAAAARFLADLRAALEEPYLLL